jgi:hypothetical protein
MPAGAIPNFILTTIISKNEQEAFFLYFVALGHLLQSRDFMLVGVNFNKLFCQGKSRRRTAFVEKFAVQFYLRLSN